MAGAVFGGGLWDLVAGGDERGWQPRLLIDESITPVWEANHVWVAQYPVLLPRTNVTLSDAGAPHATLIAIIVVGVVAALLSNRPISARLAGLARPAGDAPIMQVDDTFHRLAAALIVASADR